MIQSSDLSGPLLDYYEVLGNKPDFYELDRLVDHYPTYNLEWRQGLLEGYFQDKSIQELVEAKLLAKNLDRHDLSAQSLGGHTRWVKLKIRKTIIRLLYLRYRLDQGMTKREANGKLVQKFGSDKVIEDARSSIRKATHTKFIS